MGLGECAHHEDQQAARYEDARAVRAPRGAGGALPATGSVANRLQHNCQRAGGREDTEVDIGDQRGIRQLSKQPSESGASVDTQRAVGVRARGAKVDPEVTA